MTAVNDRGVEDAAILLMSLGEDDASEVLRQLAPKVVHRIGEAITRLRSVPRERVDDVVTRFVDRARSENYLVPDPDGYVRNLLTKALGDEKARFMIERILHGSDTSGIDSLKWMEPEAVAELLRNEHPQIVAALLAHLDPEQSSDVLKLFSERARHEVLVRLATLEGIKPSALADLNEVMIKSLSGVENRRKSNLGGIKVTAEVINLLGTALEARALDYIKNVDADLMNRIADNMFTFDDLERLDPRAMQTLLKQVEGEPLLLALKGAVPALREHFFANMSTRAADNLREELESRGPVRVADVETAQKEIVKTARLLADEGQIALGDPAAGQQFID
jgi:flagellar motor switch protein FliG